MQWFQLHETPSENSVSLIYLRFVRVMIHDQALYVVYYIGTFLLAKLHTFAFENQHYIVQQQVVTFFCLQLKARLKLQFQSGRP